MPQSQVYTKRHDGEAFSSNSGEKMPQSQVYTKRHDGEAFSSNSGEKMPQSLVRSKTRDSALDEVYVYERIISFQKGGRVNVMKDKDLFLSDDEFEKESASSSDGFDMVRMIKPIERGVRRGRGLKRSQSTMISKRRDTSQSKEMAKELASKPEEANKSGDPHESFMAKAQDSFLAKHLTPDLATSDKLISHKMDICHKAQLTECQELCELYETVSQLDVQMSHCKTRLTRAMLSKDRERSLICKEDLLDLHFKMMTVQFHVKLHKEFLAIKEKSFQDLLSAKSCIKDTTSLISCLSNSISGQPALSQFGHFTPKFKTTIEGESDGFEKRRLRGVRKKGMLEEVVCRQSYPAFLARPLGG